MSAIEYETRTVAIMVMPKDEAVYGERATTIRVEDNAAGEFVEVEQHGADGLGKVQINPEEWPALRAAIDRMILECRE